MSWSGNPAFSIKEIPRDSCSSTRLGTHRYSGDDSQSSRGTQANTYSDRTRPQGASSDPGEGARHSTSYLQRGTERAIRSRWSGHGATSPRASNSLKRSLPRKHVSSIYCPVTSSASRLVLLNWPPPDHLYRHEIAARPETIPRGWVVFSAARAGAPNGEAEGAARHQSSRAEDFKLSGRYGRVESDEEGSRAAAPQLKIGAGPALATRRAWRRSVWPPPRWLDHRDRPARAWSARHRRPPTTSRSRLFRGTVAARMRRSAKVGHSLGAGRISRGGAKQLSISV